MVKTHNKHIKNRFTSLRYHYLVNQQANMHKFILIFVALVFLIQGCVSPQTYEGERLPLDKVAVLYQPAPKTIGSNRLFVSVTHVDGKLIGNPDQGFIARKLEVLPGERRFTYQYGVRSIAGLIGGGLAMGLGGALGGALYGLTEEATASNAPPTLEVDHTVEAGKSYVFYPELINENTGFILKIRLDKPAEGSTKYDPHR